MSTLLLIERLRDAGSTGADLSSGDPLCAAAAVEMKRLWDLADKRWHTIQGLEEKVECFEIRTPTHCCAECGALWIEFENHWSLWSAACGQCCDNPPRPPKLLKVRAPGYKADGEADGR